MTSSSWWEEVFSEAERAIYQAYRRPRADAFPWEACALLLVDVTETFLGPRLPTLEASRQLRTACGLPGWQALDHITALLASFRSAGRPVTFVKPDWAGEAHFGGTTSGEPRTVTGDPVPAAIAPIPGELVIEKPRASAFFGTALLTYLIRHGVRGLVVGGCSTSGCVRMSVVDAASHGLEVVLAVDACFDRSQLSHAVAIMELDAKYARALDSAEITRLVEAAGSPSTASPSPATRTPVRSGTSRHRTPPEARDRSRLQGAERPDSGPEPVGGGGTAIPAIESDLWPALRRYWHPLAMASAVRDKPYPVQLLGERLVLCRLGARVVCFRDLCVHRGTPLSLGWAEGETIVCAYHGWAYDADGVCVRIPAQPANRPIPKRACVESYLCEERYGIVWGCLDTPRAAIPELPEFDDPRFNSVTIGPYLWKCSAARASENFTDQSHFAWVHDGILGDRANSQTPEFEIARHGEELRYECVDRPNPVHNTRQHRIYRLHRPFTVYRRLIREGTDQVEILYYTITPHSRVESTQFLYVMRNFELVSDELERRRQLTELILEQDRVIVESQRPEELPLDLSAELHVKGPDVVSVAYRHFMAELGVT